MTQPPLTCDTCGEPINQGDPIEWRVATDNETGEAVAHRLYHPVCAPPMPDDPEPAEG